MTDFTGVFPTEYDGETFTALQLPGAVVDAKTFRDCTFTRCGLTEVTFKACHFYDCRFESCDLSLATVTDSTFTGTHFKDCKCIGINWAEINQEGKFLKPFDFEGCTLNYGTFIGLKLDQVAFKGCTARDVDFSEATMTGCNCTRTDFTESRFLHTDLSKADFTGAKNYDISPELNTLKGATFALPSAVALLRNLGIIIKDHDDETS